MVPPARGSSSATQKKRAALRYAKIGPDIDACDCDYGTFMPAFSITTA